MTTATHWTTSRKIDGVDWKARIGGIFVEGVAYSMFRTTDPGRFAVVAFCDQKARLVDTFDAYHDARSAILALR